MRRACGYHLLSSLQMNENLGAEEFFKCESKYTKIDPKEAKPEKEW